MRLTVVRGFARWLQASDPATEVPPLGWLPPRRRTAAVSTPQTTPPRCWRRPGGCAGRCRRPAMETLIALLAVTGMRVGEAIRLDRSDLSPARACSPSGTRNSARRVSSCCTRARSRAGLLPAPPRGAVASAGRAGLVVHPAGNRLNYPAVQQMFRSCSAGLDPALLRSLQAYHPRPAHSFAVNTLIRWYREGADVQACCRSCPLGWVTRTQRTYWPASLKATRARRRAARGALGRRP